MKSFNKYILVLASMIILVFSNTTFAGSQASVETQYETKQIVNFAKGVEKQLAADGARAVIIARNGRPPADLPRGISFTHTAVAVYSRITLDNGQVAYGYAIHNLYQRAEDGSKSFLLTDYPVDFFWGAAELKAGVIIPKPEVQQKLIALVASQDYKKLHNPKYSVLSNPHNSMYQNCTEFTLDMINSALYQTTDRVRLKQNAQNYFSPQKVHQSRMKLSFGSMLMKDLTLKDHKRTIRTATFGSLAAYLQQYGLAQDAYVINQDLSISRI